jgi:hypothetical protein
LEEAQEATSWLAGRMKTSSRAQMFFSFLTPERGIMTAPALTRGLGLSGPIFYGWMGPVISSPSSTSDFFLDISFLTSGIAITESTRISNAPKTVATRTPIQ